MILNQISPPQVRGPEIQSSEALGKRLAVGSGSLITEYDHMAPECVLHVPVGGTYTRFPIEPRFAEQFFQDPAIDISTTVVSYIENQALPIEYRVIMTCPLRDVSGRHRPQMDVTQFPIALFVDLQATGIFPFVIP